MFMKKFSLFVIAAAFATATFAQRLEVKPQIQSKSQIKLELPTQLQQKFVIEQPARMVNGNNHRVLTQQKALKGKKAEACRNTLLPLNPTRKAQAARKAPAKIIANQPEGTHMYMYRNASAYYVYFFYVLNANVNDGVAEVVINGDDLYFKNPISQYPTDTWIKGTISGSSVIFDFPQTVGYDSYGDELVVDLFDYDGDGWYEKSSTKTSLKYTYFRGSMTTKDADFVSGSTILGLAYAGSSEWLGYADWNIQLTPFTDKPVTAPADLVTEQYSLSRYDGYGSNVGGIVDLGVSGNDVYVKGICSDLPDGWIKGTVADGKYIFPNAQFMGATASQYLYFVGADSAQAYDDYYEEYYTDYTLNGKDITFNADGDAYNADGTFLVNGSKNNVSYVADYNSAVLTPFKEVPATPAAPIINGVNPFNDSYGYGYSDFTIQTFDTEGNFINPDKVSYQIYLVVNGQPRVLETTSDIYTAQEADMMNEWTLNYTDNWDVYSQGGGEIVFYYYVTGFEKFGVQTIYRGGGEERRSEITYYTVTDDSENQAAEPKTATFNEAQVQDSDKSIVFSYFTDDNITVAGTSKTETYDVAIKLKGDFVGSYISSILLPIIDPEAVTNVSAWLTTELRIDENGKNVPNLVSKEADLSNVNDDGFVVVTLDKPYLIGEDEVYVGYTFTVTDVDNGYGASPIALCDAQDEDGLYIHTSNTYLKWLNYAQVFAANSAVKVVLAGQNIMSNAALAAQSKEVFLQKNEPGKATLDVVNLGGNGVQSVELECDIAGQSYTTTVDLDQPIPNVYGAASTITVDVPALSEIGHYDLTVKVTKVNGQPNEQANAVSTGSVEVISFVPTHRAVLEEYTGTWCQYCPRGFIGLEEMNRLYPHDFIGISYHNGDPMEIMSSDKFPSDVAGFPDAWIDRVRETDAFAGDLDYYSYQFGIDQAWLEQCEVFAPANIDVSATYNTDKTEVTATSTVAFPFAVNNNKYLVTYVLTADELSGTSSDWAQVNAYAGAQGWPASMDIFTKAGSPVTGLKFSDVAIMAPSIYGMAGSLPETIPAEAPQTHTYTFNLAKAVSTGNENLVQDINKLNVVALLIDTETGAVVNANKCHVTSLVGIAQFASEDDNNAVSIEYFDIAGRKLAPAQATGVVLKKISYKDGSAKSVKIFVK